MSKDECANILRVYQQSNDMKSDTRDKAEVDKAMDD